MKVDASHCPLCGAENDCQLCSAAPYKGPCWCENASIPEALLARVPPEQRNTACICRACVTAFLREQVGAAAKIIFRMEAETPLTRPADTLSPSDGERDGMRRLSESTVDRQHSAQPLAIRPGDVYFDHGLMVFAEAFHLRRGYCCGNGCRHCPYPVSA